MADTSQSEQPSQASEPHTNGLPDGVEDDEKTKMRPADIDADMREMERRKRVEMIMNSRLFREELERIIESQLKDGNGPAGLLQQISDMMGMQGGRLQSGNVFRSASCVVPINDIRGIESMGYAKGEKILRCKLAAVYRLMDLYGWSQGVYNHITARLNQDQEHFLVNPFGMLYHEITASSLVKIDMQGNIVEPGTTNFGVNVTGFMLHAAIHAARPDIKCIIHVHTPSVLAVSSLKCGLLPLCQEAVVVGEISQHPFLGGLSEPEEREKIARNLGPLNKVMFLTNHGVVCCGETVEEAFFNVYNTVLACETQIKLMPMGVDNLVLVSDEARKHIYEAARRPPDSAMKQPDPADLPPSGIKKEKQWRVGGVEFEALMRMLDNAGFRTGYIYRHPLVKGEPPRPRNDVEVPPAVSSLGYLLEEEEMYKQGHWKKYVDGRKTHDRTRWLNSPNVYQKVEILETGTPDPKKITKWVDANNAEEWVAEGSPTHSSTPVKIDGALQFVPKNTDPKEFKKLQQQIKDNRRSDKITSGPQSHILEGVSWEEAKKLQDANISATGDQVILVGAASKGIIQRGFQHNALVYKTPYAKNPFDTITDEELDEYKKVVERKQRGESFDEEQSESEPLSSSLHNSRPTNEESVSAAKSPLLSPTSAASETEEESRDEPRVLRIETKQVPRPSQAEVVLSDDNCGKIAQDKCGCCKVCQLHQELKTNAHNHHPHPYLTCCTCNNFVLTHSHTNSHFPSNRAVPSDSKQACLNRNSFFSSLSSVVSECHQVKRSDPDFLVQCRITRFANIPFLQRKETYLSFTDRFLYCNFPLSYFKSGLRYKEELSSHSSSTGSSDHYLLPFSPQCKITENLPLQVDQLTKHNNYFQTSVVLPSKPYHSSCTKSLPIDASPVFENGKRTCNSTCAQPQLIRNLQKELKQKVKMKSISKHETFSSGFMEKQLQRKLHEELKQKIKMRNERKLCSSSLWNITNNDEGNLSSIADETCYKFEINSRADEGHRSVNVSQDSCKILSKCPNNTNRNNAIFVEKEYPPIDSVEFDAENLNAMKMNSLTAVSNRGTDGDYYFNVNDKLVSFYNYEDVQCSRTVQENILAANNCYSIQEDESFVDCYHLNLYENLSGTKDQGRMGNCRTSVEEECKIVGSEPANLSEFTSDFKEHCSVKHIQNIGGNTKYLDHCSEITPISNLFIENLSVDDTCHHDVIGEDSGQIHFSEVRGDYYISNNEKGQENSYNDKVVCEEKCINTHCELNFVNKLEQLDSIFEVSSGDVFQSNDNDKNTPTEMNVRCEIIPYDKIKFPICFGSTVEDKLVENFSISCGSLPWVKKHTKPFLCDSFLEDFSLENKESKIENIELKCDKQEIIELRNLHSNTLLLLRNNFTYTFRIPRMFLKEKKYLICKIGDSDIQKRPEHSMAELRMHVNENLDLRNVSLEIVGMNYSTAAIRGILKDVSCYLEHNDKFYLISQPSVSKVNMFTEPYDHEWLRPVMTILKSTPELIVNMTCYIHAKNAQLLTMLKIQEHSSEGSETLLNFKKRDKFNFDVVCNNFRETVQISAVHKVSSRLPISFKTLYHDNEFELGNYSLRIPAEMLCNVGNGNLRLSSSDSYIEKKSFDALARILDVNPFSSLSTIYLECLCELDSLIQQVAHLHNLNVVILSYNSYSCKILRHEKNLSGNESENKMCISYEDMKRKFEWNGHYANEELFQSKLNSLGIGGVKDCLKKYKPFRFCNNAIKKDVLSTHFAPDRVFQLSVAYPLNISLPCCILLTTDKLFSNDTWIHPAVKYESNLSTEFSEKLCVSTFDHENVNTETGVTNSEDGVLVIQRKSEGSDSASSQCSCLSSKCSCTFSDPVPSDLSMSSSSLEIVTALTEIASPIADDPSLDYYSFSSPILDMEDPEFSLSDIPESNFNCTFNESQTFNLSSDFSFTTQDMEFSKTCSQLQSQNCVKSEAGLSPYLKICFGSSDSLCCHNGHCDSKSRMSSVSPEITSDEDAVDICNDCKFHISQNRNENEEPSFLYPTGDPSSRNTIHDSSLSTSPEETPDRKNFHIQTDCKFSLSFSPPSHNVNIKEKFSSKTNKNLSVQVEVDISTEIEDECHLVSIKNCVVGYKAQVKKRKYAAQDNDNTVPGAKKHCRSIKSPPKQFNTESHRCKKVYGCWKGSVKELQKSSHRLIRRNLKKGSLGRHLQKKKKYKDVLYEDKTENSLLVKGDNLLNGQAFPPTNYESVKRDIKNHSHQNLLHEDNEIEKSFRRKGTIRRRSIDTFFIDGEHIFAVLTPEQSLSPEKRSTDTAGIPKILPDLSDISLMSLSDNDNSNFTDYIDSLDYSPFSQPSRFAGDLSSLSSLPANKVPLSDADSLTNHDQ